MSKSDEIVKVDMVKLLYVNGNSWTAARKALSKKYRQENSSQDYAAAGDVIKLESCNTLYSYTVKSVMCWEILRREQHALYKVSVFDANVAST